MFDNTGSYKNGVDSGTMFSDNPISSFYSDVRMIKDLEMCARLKPRIKRGCNYQSCTAYPDVTRQMVSARGGRTVTQRFRVSQHPYITSHILEILFSTYDAEITLAGCVQSAET